MIIHGTNNYIRTSMLLELCTIHNNNCLSINERRGCESIGTRLYLLSYLFGGRNDEGNLNFTYLPFIN